jgi:hypothetical protein
MNISCPHCGGEIQIIELNCKIFRHGFYKNGKQLNPHASKEECEHAVKKNLVYGCGKPFQIIEGKAIKCEYI